jgi:hypothetical protein
MSTSAQAMPLAANKRTGSSGSLPPVISYAGRILPSIRIFLLASILLAVISIFHLLGSPTGTGRWFVPVTLTFMTWLACYLWAVYSAYGTVYQFTSAYIVCISMFHFALVVPGTFGLVDLPQYWSNTDFSAYLEQAAWYVLLAFSALGIGFSLAPVVGKSRHLTIPQHKVWQIYTRDFGRYSAYALLLACPPLLFLAFMSYGNLLTYSRAEIFASTADSRGWGVFMMFFPGAVVLWTLSARQGWERKCAWLLAFLGFSLLMLSGYRSAALFTLVTGAVIWVKLGRRIPLWLMVTLTLVILFAISFAGILRQLGPYDQIGAKEISYSLEKAEISDSLATTGQTLGVFAHVLRLVPDEDPYRLGQNYWIALRAAVPNVLAEQTRRFGRAALGSGSATSSSRIRDLAPADWLTYRIAPDHFHRGFGVGFSGIGEPYLSFGPAGIVGFFLALGIALGRLDLTDLRVHPKLFVFSAAMLWPLMRTARNDIGNFIKPFVFITIALIFWWLALRLIGAAPRLRRMPPNPP